ncbi:MAG TPA: hypothetical protein VK426_02780 [Methanobacterium sp.]|nr:hypothetical protein [Methanobacterium sp.]
MFELKWILTGVILVITLSILSYLLGVWGNALGILVAIAIICYMIFKQPKNHSKLKKIKYSL